MERVGVRELADHASRVVDEVHRTGHAVIVTRRGRPIAAIHAIDEDAFYDYVLATAPEYVRDMRETEDRFARGESDSRPLSDVLTDLDDEDHHRASA